MVCRNRTRPASTMSPIGLATSVPTGNNSNASSRVRVGRLLRVVGPPRTVGGSYRFHSAWKTSSCRRVKLPRISISGSQPDSRPSCFFPDIPTSCCPILWRSLVDRKECTVELLPQTGLLGRSLHATHTTQARQRRNAVDRGSLRGRVWCRWETLVGSWRMLVTLHGPVQRSCWSFPHNPLRWMVLSDSLTRTKSPSTQADPGDWREMVSFTRWWARARLIWRFSKTRRTYRRYCLLVSNLLPYPYRLCEATGSLGMCVVSDRTTTRRGIGS